MAGSSISSSRPYASLNAMVDTVASLHLAPPVLIASVQSRAHLDGPLGFGEPSTPHEPRARCIKGAVMSRIDFSQRPSSTAWSASALRHTKGSCLAGSIS